jgi:hypothetical protein
VRWFATAGVLDPDVSSETWPEVTLRAPGAGAVTMWAVLDDGRGGVAWTVRTIEPL